MGIFKSLKNTYKEEYDLDYLDDDDDIEFLDEDEQIKKLSITIT